MSKQRKHSLLFRKRLIFFLKSILLISCVFIVYQIIMFVQLTNEINKDIKHNLIVGIHNQQKHFYTPNELNQFVCIASMEKIDFKLINDNYCDCIDGSDEPGTNACANGRFYCTTQTNYLNYLKTVPSSKVNDGICDCCDGSDEWMHKELPNKLSGEWQGKLHRYQSPCPNLCNSLT